MWKKTHSRVQSLDSKQCSGCSLKKDCNNKRTKVLLGCIRYTKSTKSLLLGCVRLISSNWTDLPERSISTQPAAIKWLYILRSNTAWIPISIKFLGFKKTWVGFVKIRQDVVIIFVFPTKQNHSAENPVHLASTFSLFFSAAPKLFLDFSQQFLIFARIFSAAPKT